MFYNNRSVHGSLGNIPPKQQWNKYLTKINKEQTSNIFISPVYKGLIQASKRGAFVYDIRKRWKQLKFSKFFLINYRYDAHSHMLVCLFVYLHPVIKIIMIFKKSILLVNLILIVSIAKAQKTLPIPRNIQEAYNKNTRSTTGNPGKNYWQNTANYVINVHFYPGSRQLNGTVTIDYTNNSTDTLKEIWFKLYPNIYKKGLPRAQKIEPDDESDGMYINNITINTKYQRIIFV